MGTTPLAYFLTWTTYGSWLHGDRRGSVRSGERGIQRPDMNYEELAVLSMSESEIVLSPEQRVLVDSTIRRHCEIRNWTLYAQNVRSNHVHAVISAPVSPEKVMAQLKAWCSRKLGESCNHSRRHWWTEHGSTRWINDEKHLRATIQYVLDHQGPTSFTSE
ncbi:MAG: transposase [Planctomycetia bacterium]|jgi:REP element-mobilizing transposase RayT|nr:transposase [Planctomycetia bacterium]OQZ05515.1 MAG: hypothetical protein B6D36_09745 [Planctomycetes bacterium UTPLA1]